MTRAEDSKLKYILMGAAFFASLTAIVVTAMVGWRHVPGVLGEWLGVMVGVMSTPFLLEGTFIFIGIITVLSINIWRRHKDGDEFVYLDQVSGPDVPDDLPDTAKWAVYSTQPLELEGVEPSALEQAEGALAIGDHQTVTRILGEMSAEELVRPEVLKLRIELARATGLTNLAERLAGELRVRVEIPSRP